MKINVILSFCLIALLAACTPGAQIQKSWSDPSLTSGSVKPFKKILVVASLKDEASRRVAEDKMAAAIKRSTAVKSYEYPAANGTDEKLMYEQLNKDGFDAILMMRLTDIEKSTSYVPGATYGVYRGYHYADPGYYQENKTFVVETNAYSLLENKLIWSIATTTMNPTKLDKSIDGVIYSVTNELTKKGLIPKE
jgi:hypothetical protein